MSRHKKIMVIRLSAFGDVIRSFGSMYAIRKYHPDAHITWMTTKPFAALAKDSGYFDDVLVIERWKLWQVGKWMKFAKTLRSRGIELVYDLQRNDRTSMLRRMAPSQLRKKWFGVQKPEVDDVLDTRDITGFPLPDVTWMTADVSGFGIKPPYVLLVPGSAPQHPVKRWPAESYAKLAAMMVENGITPIALGTATEKDIIARMKEITPGVVDIAGQTSFMDIAELARHADCVVGNDTGPMHVIALTGCPLVSLFSGTTDPEKCKPQGNNVTTLRADIIGDIPVQDVWDAFLARKRG